MRFAHRMDLRGASRLAVGLLSTMVVAAAHAGAIPANTFLQFGFAEAGLAATGCDPADPAGPFCIPSSGTPTSFLDAPPWTFTADTDSTLRVIDVFESGDQFEVFDFGISIGLTSVPDGITDCGDDPAVCLVEPGMSTAAFLLAAGSHSITLIPTLSLGEGGAGYLFLVAVVPEPGTLGLALLTGLFVLGFSRRTLDRR
jgi:hypothetical protein